MLPEFRHLGRYQVPSTKYLPSIDNFTKDPALYGVHGLELLETLTHSSRLEMKGMMSPSKEKKEKSDKPLSGIRILDPSLPTHPKAGDTSSASMMSPNLPNHQIHPSIPKEGGVFLVRGCIMQK
jgi:hypothetical protein